MGQEFVMKNVMLFYDGRCHQILVFRYVFLSALILVCVPLGENMPLAFICNVHAAYSSSHYTDNRYKGSFNSFGSGAASLSILGKSVFTYRLQRRQDIIEFII